MLRLHCSARAFWTGMKFSRGVGQGQQRLTSSRRTTVRLTGSAFVPDNEVFAAAGTLVGPEDAAVDEDLTASSVLALVQHFLGHKEEGG